MEAMAPSTGKPAARKPPKTTTMTAKLTGSAMPSPRWPSTLTWWTIRSTRPRRPPRSEAVAPLSRTSRSKTVSTAAVAASSSSAVLSGSNVTIVANPPAVGVPSRSIGAACGPVGPSGTTNGLTAEVTVSTARRSRTAVVAAVAAAGSVRSTPSTSRVYVLKPLPPASARTARPAWFSPSTTISPVSSRSNRLGVPRPPRATAKPATTKSSQPTRTARACVATNRPQRSSAVRPCPARLVTSHRIPRADAPPSTNPPVGGLGSRGLASGP